jgi:hypothetical protein
MFCTSFPAAEILFSFCYLYFSPFPSLLFSYYFLIFSYSSMVFFSVSPPPFPSLHPALFLAIFPRTFLQCWNFAWQAHQPCGRISWQVRIKGKSDLVTSPEWLSVNLPWSSSPQARNFAIIYFISPSF